MAYRFEADEDLREAFFRCGREQLDNAVAALSEGIAEDPVAAVHSARKAVKQERSLLRLTRGAMPRKQRRRENRALRAAARGLCETRDAEAMIATVTSLSKRYVGQLPETTFQAIRGQLERVRDRQRDRAGSARDARAVQELGAVRLRVDDWKLRRDDWKAIDAGLLRSYREGRTAFAEARQRSTAERLHAWRKRAKDLWYQQRLIAPACGPAVRGQAKDAHQLADLLGDDHDLAELRRTLTRDHVDAAVDLDAVVKLIDHRRAELQALAFRLGERVYAEKPQAYRRRMQRAWTAGRSIANVPREQQPAELAALTRVV
ncbi:MAG: CHAD domain-containing protein [Actinomycetota bacterium]|nr:CHAD domain-containing protein [Actinomycetota bacterium]